MTQQNIICYTPPFLINQIVNFRRIQVKANAIRFFYEKINQPLTPFLCY